MIVKIEAEIFWSCIVILGCRVEVRAEKRGWTKFIENPAERRREGGKNVEESRGRSYKQGIRRRPACPPCSDDDDDHNEIFIIDRQREHDQDK